jgi:hypothetical protein
MRVPFPKKDAKREKDILPLGHMVSDYVAV